MFVQNIPVTGESWMNGSENWPSSMCLHKENSWVWTEGRKDCHGPSHCSREENSETELAVLTASGATPGKQRYNMLRSSSHLLEAARDQSRKRLKNHLESLLFPAAILSTVFAMPTANRMHDSVRPAEYKWHTC